MHNSHHLSVVLNYVKIDKDIQVIFDFTECTYIDSTFIGILAGYAINAKNNGKTVICNNVSDKIKESLVTMGIVRFLKLEKDVAVPAEGYKELSDLPISSIDRTRYILDAHKTLVEISEDNKKRFADVMRFLELDLKTQEEGQ